jgi:hypothetical protein
MREQERRAAARKEHALILIENALIENQNHDRSLQVEAVYDYLRIAGLLTAPDALASAAPADDTEMRDIIRDWWLNAETREPDAQEPTDLPDTLTRYLAARGYVITAPGAAASGMVCISVETARDVIAQRLEVEYEASEMTADVVAYLIVQDMIAADWSEKGNT